MNLINLWKIEDNPPKTTDCFIVLSYAAKNSLTPTKMTKSCVELTFKWWKKFPKAKIIMSTGNNQNLGVSNAKIMADYAISIGMPKEKIILEDKSVDTYENLIFSREIVKENNFKNPTLVCFDLHTKRALMVARKMGWASLYWLSSYSKGDKSNDLRHFPTASRFTTLIYEIISLVYFKFKGQV